MRKQVDIVNQKSEPAEDDVLELMHAVMFQVRSHRHRLRDGSDADVGHAEGKVLGFFTRHPGATQTDLVAQSGRDKGQLARLIAGLKERGLLEARADERDRRVIRLWPTEWARALHTQVQQQRRQLSAAAVAGLSAAQKRQLLDLLRVVKGNLQSLAEATEENPP